MRSSLICAKILCSKNLATLSFFIKTIFPCRCKSSSNLVSQLSLCESSPNLYSDCIMNSHVQAVIRREKMTIHKSQVKRKESDFENTQLTQCCAVSWVPSLIT